MYVFLCSTDTERIKHVSAFPCCTFREIWVGNVHVSKTHHHLRHRFRLLQENNCVLVAAGAFVPSASGYHELAHSHPEAKVLRRRVFDVLRKDERGTDVTVRRIKITPSRYKDFRVYVKSHGYVPGVIWLQVT